MPLAKKIGFSDDDLELLWQALINMFEHDRSASKGLMTTRGLYVFKHSSLLGSAPARTLLDRIQVSKKDPSIIPRRFEDYEVKVNEDQLPKGVSLLRMIE